MSKEDDHSEFYAEAYRESESISPSLPFPYFVPITQFCLRLLGVYFLIGGISDFLAQAVALLCELPRLINEGLYSYDYITFGQAFGAAFYATMGAYLIVGNSWLIEKVFLPTTQKFVACDGLLENPPREVPANDADKRE